MHTLVGVARTMLATSGISLNSHKSRPYTGMVRGNAEGGCRVGVDSEEAAAECRGNAPVPTSLAHSRLVAPSQGIHYIVLPRILVIHFIVVL